MISIEREQYHRLLDDFIRVVLDGVVYDIGKSLKHDYSAKFPNYKSVDINGDTNPNIIANMEIDLCTLRHFLCNGVTEQCGNPFNLIDNIFKNQEREGFGLWGVCLTGYPLYDTDYFRFTLPGIKRALGKWYTVREHVVLRNQIPSYYYAIVRKP